MEFGPIKEVDRTVACDGRIALNVEMWHGEVVGPRPNKPVKERMGLAHDRIF